MTKVSSLPISCEARAAALTTARACPRPRIASAASATSSPLPDPSPPEHASRGVDLAPRDRRTSRCRRSARRVELASCIDESCAARDRTQGLCCAARALDVGGPSASTPSGRRGAAVGERHCTEHRCLEPSAPAAVVDSSAACPRRHDDRAECQGRASAARRRAAAATGGPAASAALGAAVARVPTLGSSRGHERGAQAPFADLARPPSARRRAMKASARSISVPVGLHARGRVALRHLRSPQAIARGPR